MYSVIGLFFGLILAATASADTFTLSEISGNGRRAEVKIQGSLLEGDFLRHTDKFEENCDAKVIKVTGAQAIIDISSCDNTKDLKVGAEFKRISASASKQSASAAPPPVAAAPKEDSPTKRRISNDESWYTLWGVGLSSVNYGDNETDDAFEDADKVNGVDRGTFNYDLFGFYWPFADKKSMQGFIINVILDRLDGPGGTIDVSQTMYAYSYQKFFGENIGDGWFLRGDLGLVRALVDIDTDTLEYKEDEDFGLGLTAGGGYALALSSEARILLGGYLTSRKSGSEDALTTSLTVGFLF